MEERSISGRETNERAAVTSSQMKEIERRADEAGLSYYQMMENAGTGAAEYIASEHPVAGKTVFIFCGKGNNGGDGFVVSRKLVEKGASVRLFLAEGEPKTADAVKNKKICDAMGIPATDLTGENAGRLDAAAEGADLIVDAVYGTGFHGALRQPARRIVRMINGSKAAVYALDIPSGLNGDTGEADEDAVRAGCTIAFHRLKPAHLMGKCAVFCGKTVCLSIGIDDVLDQDVPDQNEKTDSGTL
ncbi:MAG TPA: NAD(P)H-hydrate epimerase [Bacillota bacterium]|nr:NAD(P)H-hydrate epimerase [Bacillota bacterium]